MLPQTIKTRGLHVGVRFAPAAVLDKAHKQQFQIKASEGFDWRKQEYADNAWHLVSPQSQGDPRSQLKLSVSPDLLNFEDFFPIGPFDVYLDNLKLALETVASVFNPRLIVATGIIIRLTAQSAGDDARVFLGQRCLGLDARLSPLGRPVHAVGLKLLLPPLPGPDKPNWQAEVKVETLIEDVRQLFIEVDARWAQPGPWDPQVAVDRAKIAHEFTTTRIVELLKELGGSDPA
ncbi:MAG: hypothetical protein HS101_18860 [Planctomycetia bacterium]|nr:hypothetical protein [Planctomycetia bacterium]MCC7315538.1 hypothetical protein [Planctomycetota bacterium]